MGTKGRELVGPKADELIEDLKKAYADEWIAYYYYSWGARNAAGVSSPGVASELERIAKEELEHADELADRIIYIGGVPPKNFEEIVKISNCKKVDLPAKMNNLTGIIKAVIEAERCALDVYQKILGKLRSKDGIMDPQTFHIIRHIMGEEIEHEDTFETLLGE